ncbi:hypothetical protein ACWF0M_01585 [Kribbella sp. NPDC055110]
MPEASTESASVAEDVSQGVTAHDELDSKASRLPKAQYPFPRRTLEEALRIPSTLRTHNGGEPYAPSEIAKALGIGGKTGNFFYLTGASRDYGFTEGTRDAALVSLTPLGKQAVYPTSDEEAADAKLKAFLNVEKFKQMLDHYKGSLLPEDEFVRNTLETRFGLDPRTHDEFLELWRKNCRYLGIGADWKGPGTARTHTPTVDSAQRSHGPGLPPVAPAGIDPLPGKRPICFVAMPFSEKTEQYAPGFFAEVYESMFVPAIEDAGFEPRTARRQGSDVIHATIVNELLDADLVLIDLTEHNPNVLFELGIRIAMQKPTVLVKATGTNPIFDVDHLLRVVSYNPNMWPRTVVQDIPKLSAHIKGAWDSRTTERPYMAILRQDSTTAAV